MKNFELESLLQFPCHHLPEESANIGLFGMMNAPTVFVGQVCSFFFR